MLEPFRRCLLTCVYTKAAMLCVQVSELQGNVQDLQEALDKETAHKDSQSTLEEAYRHRNRLDARYGENTLPRRLQGHTLSCVWKVIACDDLTAVA